MAYRSIQKRNTSTAAQNGMRLAWVGAPNGANSITLEKKTTGENVRKPERKCYGTD